MSPCYSLVVFASYVLIAPFTGILFLQPHLVPKANCCFEQSRVDYLLLDGLKLIIHAELPMIGADDAYDEDVSVFTCT